MSSGNGADLPVTLAGEFRKMREQGEKITLPTGRIVRMRVVKPSYLLKLGKIPDFLSELVIQILYGKITDEQYKAHFAPNERKDHAVEMSESLRVVCTAALVEPKVVDNPQADDEIHIDDLEDSEQRFVFDLALLEASTLSRFRQKQIADVAGMEQGQSDLQQAVTAT